MFKAINEATQNLTLTAGAWNTVNVSALVPSNATGIVASIDNVNIISFGVRSKGSTESIYAQYYGSCFTFIAPLNANKEFELYSSSASVTLRIHGFFYDSSGESGTLTWRSTAASKTVATSSSWVTLSLADLSPPAGASAAIVEARLTAATAYQVGMRPVGSTINALIYLQNSYSNGYMLPVKLDASNQIQVYTGSAANTTFYIRGWIIGGNWLVTWESDSFNNTETTITLGSMTSGGYALFTIQPAGSDAGAVTVRRDSTQTNHTYNKVHSNTSTGPHGVFTLGSINTTTTSTYLAKTTSAVTLTTYLLAWWQGTHEPPTGLTATPQFQLPAAMLTSWNSVFDATSYDIQQDTNSSFPAPTTVNTTNTSNTFTNLGNNTLYYYRVRANGYYGSSAWSSVISQYTYAKMQITSANPIKDNTGATVTGAYVLAIRQSDLTTNVTQSDIGTQKTVSVIVNKVDTYPATMLVPGGASTDKVTLIFFKPGTGVLAGECHPDVDPTTTA